MKTQKMKAIGAMLVGTSLVSGPWARESRADTVCVENSGETKHVCVAWGNQQYNPVEGTHFVVDYECTGCSDAPDVELRTGDTGWVVYSEVISSGAPANIGALTTTDSDNYKVKIAKGTAAGAADVGSMVLTPDGASYYSSILSGSKISGDLTGDLTLQKSSGGSGGSLSFSISGDLEGDVIIPVVSSLTIGGLTSTASIDVTDEVDGSLTVSGTVESGATITIGDTTNATLSFSMGSGSFAGCLDLDEGLADNRYAFIGPFTGLIDLNGERVDGTLDVGLGGSGTIQDGGVVGGGVWLAAGSYYTFTGTATFAGVDGSGWIKLCGGTLAGEVHIGDGGLNGQTNVSASYLNADGLIDIDGSVSANSNIHIGNDLAGEITVAGDLSGNLTIGGDIADGALIDIDGEMTGEICADNLDPDEVLPDEVDIASFGPAWTICDEFGCTCDGASCTNDYDCNNNDTYDLCEVLDRTVEDCDCDSIPDAGGTCDPANQDAKLAGSVPGDEGSLWRTQKNITRFTFCCDVTAPDSGDVLIQEMLDEGDFGDDLSSGFSFTVENDSSGDPRILKINETGSSLDHETWYAIRNTGDWDDVAEFERQYVVMRGNANEDGYVDYGDLSVIYAAIYTDPADDDDRRDIDGDATVSYGDLSVADVYVPSSEPDKPSGH